MSAADIAAARARAAKARADLLATAHVLQERVRPATLAENALVEIKRRGEETAHKRPLAVAAAAGGVIALVAARPVARLLGAVFKRKGGNARAHGDKR